MGNSPTEPCKGCEAGHQIRIMSGLPAYHFIDDKLLACTAMTPDAHIAALTARVAELEKDQTEEVSEEDDAYGDPEYWMDEASKLEAERDELRTRLQQSNTTLEKYGAICDVLLHNMNEIMDSPLEMPKEIRALAFSCLNSDLIAAEVERRKAVDTVVQAMRKILEIIRNQEDYEPVNVEVGMICMSALESLDAK